MIKYAAISIASMFMIGALTQITPPSWWSIPIMFILLASAILGFIYFMFALFNKYDPFG